MRPHEESFASLAHAHPGRKPGGGAIYHMKVRTASRSKGQSARAAASYIERTEEYGRDPESAAELVYTESGHMPGWADADVGGAFWAVHCPVILIEPATPAEEAPPPLFVKSRKI